MVVCCLIGFIPHNLDVHGFMISFFLLTLYVIQLDEIKGKPFRKSVKFSFTVLFDHWEYCQIAVGKWLGILSSIVMLYFEIRLLLSTLGLIEI